MYYTAVTHHQKFTHYAHFSIISLYIHKKFQGEPTVEFVALEGSVIQVTGGRDDILRITGCIYGSKVQE